MDIIGEMNTLEWPEIAQHQNPRRRPAAILAVVALYQGAPGQMSWLRDPPHWLRPGSKIREFENQNSLALHV